MALHRCREVLVLLSLLVSTRGLELTVLHTNDVHSRIEEADTTGGGCSAAEAAAGECYGGVARMATKVKEIRRTENHVLLLDGGDEFQGTPWFLQFKGLASSRFMNKLQYDAMAIGNHEFDNGISGLVPFLRNVTFPMLACNIDTSGEPELQGLILPSVVLDVGGERVGIVGYILENTPDITGSTGNLVFLDEVDSVQAEVTNLQGQGVNKIIALGHAGYYKDLEVAQRVSGVDLVVGGHTNTFLYNGDPPSSEVPVGPYPRVVSSQVDPGREVPVVQAHAYGKYLGYLRLEWDSAGDLVRWDGNPVILDSSVPKDPEILAEVEALKAQMNNTCQVIGRTHVLLNGEYETCTEMECNMGNLITDAMVHQNIQFPDGLYWSDVAMAIYNSDGIRSSIPKGMIDIEAVQFTLPFSNTFDIVELRGEHLYDVFEHSGAGWSYGRFLQVSGILVQYDRTKPTGSRVVSLETKCTDCEVPEFRPVQRDAVYKLIAPSYLANGGSGYTMISDNKISHHVPAELDTEALIEYIRATSPITTGLDRRITFGEGAPPCASETPQCPSCPSETPPSGSRFCNAHRCI
ncbi:snake venom 5'-nucleotidase-like [Branchiostoma floridae]|uniref:5'-nucleotidase n=1 Tax=Branchiostoma floridae TaxID=7739 RepID=A0A9J7MAN1_BRAFL|nr:snake venom 5'-nucleotidase-like [Branchiostoma floridae]